jgi:hypothetical protein
MRSGLSVVLLALALGASAAQDGRTPPRVRPDCGSVVVVECEPRWAPAQPRTVDEAARRERGQAVAARRTPAETHEFERIIIEGEALRRRTLEEAMAPAFPQSRPVDGTFTYTVAEGAQCTCMNRCPPIPFPCCQCSGHMNRYANSPGASPLR